MAIITLTTDYGNKDYSVSSLKAKLILENINLFIKIFLGLLKDKIWLKEYLVNE